MGGFGSGNRWQHKRRKRTVEESLVLSVKHFTKARTGATGTIRWSWGNNSSSIGYRTEFTLSGAFVWLNYKPAGGAEVNAPVCLCSTSTQFNGQRLWFRCPLSVNGVRCSRRAAKLYLPPGARYFGCRVCHNLAYKSSQRAHFAKRLEGTFASFARRFGTADNRASA